MNVFEIVKEDFIKLNGIKLHMISIGSGEPLVLLHGFPDFWYGWKNIILGLKDEFKLIVPDTRGINLSDKPLGVEDYQLKLLVDDVKILSEKLNLGRFSLAGHDWGGVIAWGFANKYPEKLKKLIVLDSPHYRIMSKQLSENKKQKKASGYIFQMLKPGGEQGLIRNNYQLLKFAVFENARKKDAFTEFDKEKYVEAWSQPGAILAGVNYYRANRSFKEWSGVIKTPTLVIHGMKDTYVKPGVLEGLDEYVKDLTIVKAEEASHWVMHDAPELVASNFRRFISK